jgi:hypothetical protein
MSDFKLNPETGEYEYVGTAYEGVPEAADDPDAESDGSLFAPSYGSPELRAAEGLEAEQQATAVAAREEYNDERPLWAESLGQFGSDLGKNLLNPAAALVTDYVDLGHGLVDIAQQTGNLVQGKGFDWNKVFDDSDNPLTEYRINTVGRSETGAGQFLNTTSRVVVALATLPKTAIKWGIVAPLKALSKVPVAGKLAGAGAKLATKTDDAIKAGREGTKATTTALNAIQKGAPNSKAAALANADDWLKLTYKDVVNAGAEGGRFATVMRSTERAAKSLTKGKASVRTVGEALAWDAFVAFNAAGEGNPMLDETFTDFLDEAGVPHVAAFRTSIRDTGLELKAKQMLEGTILGGIVSSVTDVARIYRFSRAFQRADDAEKALIVKALNEEGERLGGSVGRLGEQAEAIALLPSRNQTASMKNYQLLDEELDKVNAVRDQIAYTQETQANLLKQQQVNAQIEDQINAVNLRNADDAMGQPMAGPEGAPIPASVRVDGQAQLPPGAKGGALAPDQTIQPADIQVMRPPEPTITPQTMRAGFQQYVVNRFAEQGGEFIDQLLDTTKRLMPRNRVDAIDLLEQFPLRYNGLGVMEASESITKNYLIERGLAEGWMSVDSDLALMYNRKLAFDFDANQYAVKQATALDEAAEIERYNARLLEQGSDPATQPVQNELARMEARDALDESAIGKSTLGESADPDMALVEAKRQEQLAATQEAGAKNAEQQQVDIDAIAAYGDIGSDRQVVAEMLNLDLDNLPEYGIEKIGNRQYQVVDEFGESIDGNTYSTLKGARKGVDVAGKAQRKEYVAKARALADRAADQPVQSRIGVDFYDSPAVRGELSLTKRQAEILNELGVPINGTKLDLSQADLAGMAQSIKQLMESVTPNQRRVLGNILKRVDEKVIDLGPKARLQAEVDKTAALSQKFLKDGEICF